MPGHHMSELGELAEDHEDPREMPDTVAEQLFWAMQEDEGVEEEGVEEVKRGEEEEEAVSLSSPSSFPSVLFIDFLDEVSAPEGPQDAGPSLQDVAAFPWSQSEDESSSSHDEEGPNAEGGPEDDADSLFQKALRSKMAQMVEFMLLKFRTKEPTTKAEMLSSVVQEYNDHFPEIFSAATEVMKLIFGVVVMEVDPSVHTYVMITALGLTYDGMVGQGNRYPNTGLLVTVLWIIAAEGDCAPEEKIWEALNVLGVHDGKEHWVYGEPRGLITKIWVQEQYLVYRQVPNSNPARYEFLWGPRAHAETTPSKALNYVLRVNVRDPRTLPPLPDGPEYNEKHYV